MIQNFRILLPIKSTVPSTVFLIAFLKVALSTFAADCLAWLRSFLPYLPF